MKVKKWLDDTLIGWYVKREEIKILDEVAVRQNELRKSRDDYHLSRLLEWFVGNFLGYRNDQDKFKQLCASLIKRKLLRLEYICQSRYLDETEEGKKYLAEYESFVRSSCFRKLSKILEHHFSSILITLIVGIISSCWAVYKWLQ